MPAIGEPFATALRSSQQQKPRGAEEKARDKQTEAVSTSNSFKSFARQGNRETGCAVKSLPTPKVLLRHFVCWWEWSSRGETDRAGPGIRAGAKSSKLWEGLGCRAQKEGVTLDDGDTDDNDNSDKDDNTVTRLKIARHYLRHFYSFNCHADSKRKVLLLSPFTDDGAEVQKN